MTEDGYPFGDEQLPPEQLRLDFPIQLWCQCCGDEEAETGFNDKLVCYPCAYHLAN